VTLQEIVDANPDKVNYIVQQEGNTDANSRYLVNTHNESSVKLQQINTMNFFDMPSSTSGYEVYTPPLENPLAPYEIIVQNAIEFFQEIMVTYAAENITMGITVLNKTKDVADYLQGVMRYGQSGSLYEVIHEIDTLKADGIPVELAPFVTDERLDAFKLKITNYIGV